MRAATKEAAPARPASAEEVLFRSPEQFIVRVDAGRVRDVEALGRMCGRYGALQRSRLKASSSDGKHFLHYYTRAASESALRGLDGASFEGRPLEVSRGMGTGAVRMLGRDDCVDLANTLLGFRGWSHRIVSLDRRRDSDEVVFDATVAVSFALDPRLEALGRGEGRPNPGSTKADAFAASKKRAINHAIEASFRDVRLRVKRGKKATAVRLCAAAEPADPPR